MVVFLEIIYIFIIIYGRLIVIRSSSWIIVWIGFELNILSFVVMFGSKRKIIVEAIYKYFFVQVVGSIIILFFCIIFRLSGVTDFLLMDYFIEKNIILLVIIWKLGGGPFFFWLPVVSEGLRWTGNFIFITWQKISTLWIIGLISFGEKMVVVIGLYSVVAGCFGGFNQLLIKKIFIYSSIVHIGWILILGYLSFYIIIFYYFFYVILRGALIIFFINREIFHVTHLFLIKGSIRIVIIVFISLFSLGGLPPLLGIFPKWLGLLSLLRGDYLFVCYILLLLGVISLYYYLRLGYGILIFLNYSCKWSGHFSGVSVLNLVILGFSCFFLWYFILVFI